ncbi:sensor histidine kinase [Niabella ginsenosidivorans]|nr:histidine kinase [Niabella ginsenosidivorans]
MVVNRNTILVTAHVLGWVLGLGLILVFIESGSFGVGRFNRLLFSWPFIAFLFFYGCLFYGNLFILLPRFLVRDKFIIYGIFVLLLSGATFYLKPFDVLLNSNRQAERFRSDGPHRPPPQMERPRDLPDADHLPPGPRQNGPGFREGHFDLMSITLFLVVWAISTIIFISKQWRITENKNAHIKLDKAQAELSFLKAQVSPHFLFNTLNNIYSLAMAKSDDTAAGILRLSGIMRYITDDAPKDFVPVEKELECISDFIELQRLRLSKSGQLNYQVSGSTNGVQIAPLILMPFVENVFKHGISNNAAVPVNIRIDITPAYITLYTKNRIFRKHPSTEREGVGLRNVKQRLDFLYPGNYQLQITEEAGFYIVELKVVPIVQ